MTIIIFWIFVVHMKKNEELQKTDSPRILMPSDSESESDNQFNLSFEDDLNYPSSYGKRKSTKTRGDAASEVNANEYWLVYYIRSYRFSLGKI